MNFDGITYAKGASVLKQLGAYVGVEAFLAGLRDYFAEHAYGNTTLADLLRALEKSSGRDLGEWSQALARDHRHQHDPPGVHARRRRQLHRPSRSCRPRPTEVATSNMLRPHRLAVGLLRRAATARSMRTDRVELDVAGARTAGARARRRAAARRCCWSTTTT